MYARLRGSRGPPPIGVRYRCSQLSRDAMRWVHMHNMFLSGTDFWRYLDKACNSVPGGGGFIPLHAIPCVHGLTCYGPSAFTAGFTRAPAGVCPLRGSVYISLRRTTKGHMCTLDSGGVLALHL